MTAAKPLPLVRPGDLYDLFQEVAGVFAFASCSYLGRPNPSPSEALTVEYSIRIQGPVQGTVVLRTTPLAARNLAQGVRLDDPKLGSESADAFKELANLFVGHLLTSCLGGRHQAFAPFLPEPSTPALWPKAEEDAACALLLETEAVELRYWQESQP